MPEPDYLMKVGDTGSSILATLEDSGGTAVDLLGATVIFKMAPIGGGTLVVGAAATNAQVGHGTLDGSRGDVSYQFAAAVGTAGLYCGEWEVTYAGGAIQTFPNDGHFYLLVTKDL